MLKSNFEKIICPNCKEIYNYTDNCPLILPNCGHTLCSKCITGISLKDPKFCRDCIQKNPKSKKLGVVNPKELTKNQKLLDEILQICFSTGLNHCKVHPKYKTNKICGEKKCENRGFCCDKCLKDQHKKCHILMNVEVEEIIDTIRDVHDQFDFPKITLLLTRTITEKIKKLQDNILNVVYLAVRTAEKELVFQVSDSQQEISIDKFSKKASLKYDQARGSIRVIPNNEVKIIEFVENVTKFVLEDEYGLWSHIDSLSNKMFSYIMLPYLGFRKKQTGFESEISDKISRLIHEYEENYSRISFDMEAINNLDVFYEKINKACFFKKSRFSLLKEIYFSERTVGEKREIASNVSDLSDAFFLGGDIGGRKISIKKAQLPAIFENDNETENKLNSAQSLEIKSGLRREIKNVSNLRLQLSRMNFEKEFLQKEKERINSEEIKLKEEKELTRTILNQLESIKTECFGFRKELRDHCCFKKYDFDLKLSIKKNIVDTIDSYIGTSQVGKLVKNEQKNCFNTGLQTENDMNKNENFRSARENQSKNEIKVEQENSRAKNEKEVFQANFLNSSNKNEAKNVQTNRSEENKDFSRNPRFCSLIQENQSYLENSPKIKKNANEKIEATSQSFRPMTFSNRELDDLLENPVQNSLASDFSKSTFDTTKIKENLEKSKSLKDQIGKFQNEPASNLFKKQPEEMSEHNIDFIFPEPSIMIRKIPTVRFNKSEWIFHKNIQIVEKYNKCTISRVQGNKESNEFCAIYSDPLTKSCGFRVKIDCIAEDLPYFPVGFLTHLDLQSIEKNGCLDIFNNPNNCSRFYFSGYSHSKNLKGNKIAVTANSRKGFRIGSSVYIDFEEGKFIKLYNDDKSIFLDAVPPSGSTYYLYVVLFRPENCCTVEKIF